ncbi:methyltransferase domain-containing protein [Nocardia uniformis]|uniref:Methyltransferase domain-containing protein n=2 Tax=Nocardia uniformis TaxID=53432 RepID=A0A849CC82_9NOCA|nr:methyltransferase domain-containing protein [Nocardia uniformis]
MPRPADSELKACCVQAYSGDVVSLLLGESYHPGGFGLTRQLADQLTLRPGGRVLDVACGPGATARLLATEYDVSVDGIDLAPAVLARARADAATAGLADRVRFHEGDSDALPFPADTFDVVICECALCLFPDKQSAAAEFARVLRPGGRIGLTDVIIAESGLPPELTDLTAYISCIADARPADGYIGLLTTAGLRVSTVRNHDHAVTAMLDHIEARIKLLRITAPDTLRANGLDRALAARYLNAARQAVADGSLGYTLMVAEKPR